jgi:hypothetical protein
VRERAKRGQKERECETRDGWVRMGMREWMRSEWWVRSCRKTEGVGRKDWGREDCEWGQGERARSVEIGKGWCGVCRRKRRGQKKTKGKIGGWANESGVGRLLRVLVRRANGKRRLVWVWKGWGR